MSNMSLELRKKLMPIVLEKQGDYYCLHCNKKPADLILCGVSPKLYIDHIDNNNDNNSKENLQFLCVSCNTKKNHPANEESDRRAPIEYKTSKRNNKRAREYVYGRMIEPNSTRPEKYDLIDDMAEFFDCSQESIKNYLRKMTSKRHGLYEWRVGQDGNEYLHFKNDKDREKASAENIE